MNILPLIKQIEIYEKDIEFELKDVKILTGGLNWKTDNISDELISDPKKIYSKLTVIEQKCSTSIQIYNRNSILSRDHLIYALYFSYRAFFLNNNISKNRSLEYLLYASQQRQIHSALDTVGFLLNPLDKIQEIAFSISGNQNDNIIDSFELLKHQLGDDDLFISEIESSKEKIKTLMKLYGISCFELVNSIKNKGYLIKSKIDTMDREILESALLQCLIERMSLLSIEK